MRRVAITGAGGFIGSALAGRLWRGCALRGLFRSGGEVTERWRRAGHEVVSGDLGDEDALARLVEGADLVYHLAARSGKDDPEASLRVNVEGTRRLARAARRAGSGRLVYVSTISVYAETWPESGGITEETVPREVDRLNPYSRTKYGGERVLREMERRGEGPECTIVRPTNVYGPGGRAWVEDWLRRIERMPVVFGGDVPVDMVHVDDVAAALVQAGGATAAAGATLHVGHLTLPLGEYVVQLGDAVLGRRVRRLPRVLDALVRRLVDRGHRLLHGSGRSLPLTRHVRFPHDRARRVIGYRPEVTLEEGLESVARWYRTRNEAPAS